MRILVQIGLVALGSALGGVMRWGVGNASARWFGTAFPYGTFIINVTGCLFLGWCSTVLADRLGAAESAWLRPDQLRLLLTVGLAGAYTTFSTFELETHGLLRDGDAAAGTLYILGSLALGLIAIRVGILLAQMG
jgi:CrcB protein